MSTRYFPRRKRTAKIDTAAERALIGRAEDVLQDASRAWESGEEWRRKAARNERYVFGNQWGDRVRNPETGAYTTEEELIRRQGNQPLKNNRLRVIVRSVLGVYSSAKTEPVCIARTRADQGKGEVMSATLQYVYQHNKFSEPEPPGVGVYDDCGRARVPRRLRVAQRLQRCVGRFGQLQRLFFDPT